MANAEHEEQPHRKRAARMRDPGAAKAKTEDKAVAGPTEAPATETQKKAETQKQADPAAQREDERQGLPRTEEDDDDDEVLLEYEGDTDVDPFELEVARLEKREERMKQRR